MTEVVTNADMLTALLDGAKAGEPVTVAGRVYVPADECVDKAALLRFLHVREIGTTGNFGPAIYEGLRQRLLRGDFDPATTPKGTD